MTPLHTIGEFVRNLMLRIPLPAVRVLFVGLLVALLLWVLRLPREETVAPGEPTRWYTNLKFGFDVSDSDLCTAVTVATSVGCCLM